MPKPLILVAPYPRTVSEIFDPMDLGRLHAFAEVGWAPRITHGSQDVSSVYFNDLTTSYTSGRVHRDWPTTHGVVVGGGIQFATRRLQFTPGVRTR